MQEFSVEALPFPALVLETDWTIAEVNSQFLQFSGLSKTRVVGLPLKEVVLEGTLPGEPCDSPFTLDLQFSQKQSEPCTCFFNDFSGDTDQCDKLLCVICPTCMTKQAHHELANARDMLNLALEATGIGLWDHNLETDVVQRTGQWGEMLGYDQNEIPPEASAWKTLIHPDDVEPVRRIAINHERGTTEAFQVEHRLRTKNDEWKWILNYGRVIQRDDQGAAMRAVGAHVDIDDRKKTELALRERKALFSEAETLAQLGSFDWEIRTQTPKVSPGFCKLLKLPRNVSKQKIIQSIHPDDQEGIFNKIREAMRGETHTFTSDFRVPGIADEPIRYFSGRATILRDGNGNASHLIGVIQDVTAIQRAETEMKKLISDKEWLLKEMHHRIKNNFQIISSLINLQAQSIDDDKLLSILKMSQTRIQSMAILHHKLYQSEDLSQIDVSDYLRDLCVELYRLHGGDPTQIKLQMNFSKISLGLDEAVPLGLILNELFSNAIRHAFKAPHSNHPLIHIKFHYSEKNRYHLRVSDNGVGLPEHIKEYSTLGLRLVRILIEDQLGGVYTIEREGGTCVDVFFDRKQTTR
jgi:PAS domain S-box-containing protein